MTTNWPKVRLGEVLRHRKEFIIIDDLQTYQRPRVQLHAQGIVLRDRVHGAQIKTKKQQVCRAGEFLVAEIDAKVGGFGVVPPELDAAAVSGHYFLFVVNEHALDLRFLHWFIKTPAFREQVAAQGSTNYAAIRPSDVLGYEIPLPPLAEQRRIVARMEELSAKIEEAARIRDEVEAEQEILLAGAYRRIAENAPRQPLGHVAPLIRRPVAVDPEKEYPQIAVRSFGRGTFHKPPLQGGAVTWQKPFRVEAGDILISNIKAWEGAIAVASDNDDGRVGSHRYLTCVPKPSVATARFICFHLLTTEGLYEVGQASPGSADRNRTLSAKGLLQIMIPVPSYEQQLWFDKICHEVDALKLLQSETTAELDALVPAILDRALRGEL
ncbi:MAG: restriction endonuclease subunit S [Armatimonadota bacterium]